MVQTNVEELLTRAGFKKLYKTWAKIEILLRLLAAAIW